MNSPITIDEIRSATGLSERAVRSWVSRLSIVPVGIKGRSHLYPTTVVSDIQAAQIQSGMARRSKVPTITLEAAASPTPPGVVISVAEAKRRAGRRAS